MQKRHRLSRDAVCLQAGFCLLLTAYCLLLFPQLSSAQVPRLVRYQGHAVDSRGTPLNGTNFALTFRLYDAASGGTVLWEERQEPIAIQDGHFSVLLGSVTPLATEWDLPSWLSVQVGTEPELAPRQQITSVPLAVRSEMAERLTVPVTTSNITDDANRLVPTGAVILWTGATCPAGYSRLSILDGKFLVGSAAYNAAAGGSNTHEHGPGTYRGPLHRHTGTTNSGTPPPGAGDSGISSNPSNHVHTFTTDLGGAESITGTSGAADSRPEFATVLLCQKD